MTAMGKKATHRILVIDDNPSIHEDFRKIFAKSRTRQDDLEDLEAALFGSEAETVTTLTLEVDCASQGREALEMALRAKTDGRPYAVAFVDGRMPPGWDGIETIRYLWDECPDLQVVLCTAYADYSWQEIRKVLGESDSLLILKKPFDNVEVLQLAHALTRKWELNREVQGRIENLDETVRKRTEEKDRTMALLEAALEHSPAGIIISNEDGTEILWANIAATEMLGDRLLPSETMEENGEGAAFIAYWKGGMPWDFEDSPLFRAVRKEEVIHNEESFLPSTDGSDRWISINAAPIYNADGEIIAGILIVHDISDKKNADEEKEKLQNQIGQIQRMESVGLLAGGVAHDYNNAMSVIIGNAEMGLISTDPSEQVHETLTEIKKAAYRSADLTQQLLAFARKQTIAPKVLDLNLKISEMLKMLHRLIGEDINLIWKPGEKLWPVKMDPSQIDQILLNLCVNAREAIDGVGNLTIETRNIVIDDREAAVRPELRRREYAALTITDTGRGMEKEILGRIYEPFFTTKGVGKGTGLGLATVYGIVRQNEGYIDVDSEPGNGTTFAIYLPRFDGEVNKPASEESAPKTEGRGEKVLLVEDDEDILAISKTMLEKLGYEVLIAKTPKEAIEQAKDGTNGIKLLLTDVIMPKMNGRDLAAKVRTLCPDMKCLFMSGYSADIISQDGVMEEGLHFLKKPFSMAQLSAKLRDALGDNQG